MLKNKKNITKSKRIPGQFLKCKGKLLKFGNSKTFPVMKILFKKLQVFKVCQDMYEPEIKDLENSKLFYLTFNFSVQILL